MTMKKIAIAAALVAVVSSVASAQTDFGSPLGSGGGVGGAVAPFLPAGTNAAAGGVSFGAARTAFVNATAAGVVVNNPVGGGTVTVPQAAAQALGGVLGGNPTAAQQSTLTAALGGGTVAGALVQALQNMGSSPSFTTISQAVSAFNALINSLPSGSTPSATVVAARNAISALILQ
jgi:ABC-type branched-subunit amino acid transport system substrate-binding protein